MTCLVKIFGDFCFKLFRGNSNLPLLYFWGGTFKNPLALNKLTADLNMLKGKKILLGVTGSIAAYKSAWLVRALVKEGAEVKVVMTAAGKDFITPLTLSTLSKHPVYSDIFEKDVWTNHVQLALWADIFLIAPLSCNTMAKMAGGLCDNLLMAVYLSVKCPVMAAPAMDEDMWLHPSTQKNLETLISRTHIMIPVSSGELASGLYGQGRMAEPEEIVDSLRRFFEEKKRLKGKKVLVTAGPTYEAIDPVRFIGNRSSGKMGVALAQKLLSEGAEVSLVLGPVSDPFDLTGIKVTSVQSAADMYDACNAIFDESDIAVMAAAVADYTPVAVASEKIKKKEEGLDLTLKKTRDILKSLGEKKKSGQLLVGFALETDHERENALAKLKQKNADMIILNSLRDAGAGFGTDTNKISIFDRKGGSSDFTLKPKTETAEDIVNYIIEYIHA